MTTVKHSESSAVFSDCKRYRYCLERRFNNFFSHHDGGKTIALLMLNPSTADEQVNDPTIRRCIVTAVAGGFHRLLVVNLFGWRATNSDELKVVDDPIGPANDGWIKYAADRSDTMICAWGNKGVSGGRAREVYEIIRHHNHLVRLGPLTKVGQPSHPLYLKKTVQWESMKDYQP